MKRIIKYSYVFLTLIFGILTFYEIFIYMKTNSNFMGIFYLFFNFFVMFLLFTTSYNYDVGSKNIRASKNIVAIIVGIFASFILSLLLPHLFSYTDDSYLFSDSVYVVSKIMKPIIYLILGAISVIEIKIIK